jgi:hypothetical protein
MKATADFQFPEKPTNRLRVVIVTMLLAMFISAPGRAQVVYDSNSVCGYVSSSTTTLTLSNFSFSASATSNTTLIVRVRIGGGSPIGLISSVSFASTPLTRFGTSTSSANAARMDIWYLNVSAGATGNIVITAASAHGEFIATVATFHGVDRDTPLNNLASNTFVSGTTSSSVSTTGNIGDMAIDALASDAGTPNYAATSGQTVLPSCGPNGGYGMRTAIKAQTGSSMTLGWTVNGPVGQQQAANLRQARPEINVKGNNVSIADGNTALVSTDFTDFGSVNVGGNTTKTYKVFNTGYDTLNITGANITGTDAGMFSVTASPSSTVLAGDSTLVTVTFTPTSGGAKNAVLHIASDDLDEADYDFAIQGTGVCTSTTWTGAVSTDWNDAGNWTCGIPSATVTATIPSGTPNAPNLSNASFTVSDVTQDAGQTLTLGTGIITVTGSFTNNGTIGGTGKVVLNGISAQTITGTGTISNLELDNSAGATITAGSNKLNVTGLLTLTSGTLTTNGNLVLRSTSPTATAMVGPVPGSGAGISGIVVHERYLSAPANGSGGRSWRLLTSPLKNATNNSIFYNWQNNGVNDGTGIELFSPTGTGAGLSGNGLAAGGVSASIRSFDYVTNTYQSVTNTKTTLLFDGTKNNTFMAFVPGYYGSGNITAGSSATNSDATGTLITGTQSYSFTPPNATNIYYLMGNPYACPIDFDKVFLNPGTANINRKFWVIDPNLSNIGAYATVTYTGGVYVTSSGNQNKYIQTGQGFFVEGTTPTVLSTVAIEENDKETAAPQTSMFRTNGGTLETFRVKLYKNINSTNTLLDGAVVASHQTSNNAIDGVDGIKFGNFNENIGILTAGKTLSIDARQLLDNNDTVHVSLSSMQQTSYQLVIEPGNMSASGLYATLIDNFTNTVTPVSLSANTTYNFTVTSSPSSTGTGRFSVVFHSITPLDLKFVNISAIKHGDKIDVQWAVANQDGIRTYDVERSSDAKSFSRIATVGAGADNMYNYADEAPLSGNNYYRVKAIARSSDHGVYSNIVRVNSNTAGAELNAYPNPVQDGHLQISVANLTKGSYTISLYNTVGQKAATKQLSYDGGSTVIDLNIESLANGIYLMHLTNENGEPIAEQKIVKQ